MTHVPIPLLELSLDPVTGSYLIESVRCLICGELVRPRGRHAEPGAWRHTRRRWIKWWSTDR